MITIYVHKTQARAELDAPVTSGSVGREVQFQFSDDWDGLVKTAVFETNNYKETATVPESGALAIPEDVLTYPGFQLRIGVIGKTADGATVIPTVYADCSMIKPGASTVPVGTPPTPSQAEQLQEQIDDLADRVSDLEDADPGDGAAITFFDLAAMGLPAVTPDGTEVALAADTSEMRTALAGGYVKFGFQFSYGGTTIAAELTGAPMYMAEADMYQVSKTGYFSGAPMFISIMVGAEEISAVANVLQAALPNAEGASF